MSVCFTLVSLSAPETLFLVHPSRTVYSDAITLHQRISFLHWIRHRGLLNFFDGSTQINQAGAHLRRTLFCLHAVFIVIHWFVTDSFSYPVAVIFYMAWFTVPLHDCLVVEWLLRVILLAHIPPPRVQRSAPRGLTAFIQIIGWFI